jgi:hypothetical protein
MHTKRVRSRQLYHAVDWVEAKSKPRSGANGALSQDTKQFQLFLLLALVVRLVAMLMRRLRMLLGGIRVLFAFGMIALAVMLCGGAVRLRSVLVMLGRFVMFISCHGYPPW